MTESTHTLTALVVHRLIRAAEGPSQLELRAAPNPLDDASARLMERPPGSPITREISAWVVMPASTFARLPHFFD